MCRRSSVLIIAIVALWLSPAVIGDDVAAYLERHGLQQLLAVHLEQLLEDQTGAARDDLVLRLAGLYAQLLESTDDPALRVALEERSRKLLSAAPPNTAQELRLALLRGSYRSAERVAEDHRLRQSDPEQVDRAKATLAELIPKLRQLRGQLDDRSKLAERRLTRSGGSSAVILSEEAERYHRLLAQCTFLNAWALYYQSWLNERPDNARAAELLFATLLETESSRPQPEDISVDLRSIEAIARSILGMALCKSLTASSATALRWVELLEDERTHELLHEQSPAWKVAIHLEHGEYRAARAVLEAVQANQVLPLPWVRLAAVHALEAEPNSEHATALARWAVAQLAAGGELEQVLDLAQRYGANALGTSGFAMRYVRGVQHYQHARDIHGNDRPSVDEELASLYERAVSELDAAVAEPDAQGYPKAAAGCRWLIAWCRYFQSSFLAARTAFERAAETLSSDDGPEALWMAVVCLDKVVQAGDGEALARELAELIDRFLAQYPSNPHAPRLIVKRAQAAEQVSPAAVNELLAVPQNSEAFGDARKQAALALYKLFRRSSGEQRVSYGQEYLVVAIGLLTSDQPDVPAAGQDERQPYLSQFIARCRRVLEVALSEEVQQPAAARMALDALDALRGGGDAAAPYRDEIDYRRVQERLYEGDAKSAAATGDRLWAGNPGSLWSRAAQRALFKYAHRRFAADDADDQALDLVVRAGQRILSEFEGSVEALDRPSVLAYYLAVADGLTQQWQRRGQADNAERALALYEAVLAVRPRDAIVLRATAGLAERFGNTDRALACWRLLVAGSEAGTEPWYEAKFHLISLLADVDPIRARLVMDQYKQLNPEYGPQPWAARLLALDRRIGRTGLDDGTETSEPVDDGAIGDKEGQP